MLDDSYVSPLSSKCLIDGPGPQMVVEIPLNAVKQQHMLLFFFCQKFKILFGNLLGFFLFQLRQYAKPISRKYIHFQQSLELLPVLHM